MSDDIAGLSFEDAMAQLEAIVRDLESGKGKLDDAVGAYDRGVRLRRHCEAKLAEAQAKIDKIVAGPEGAVGTEPFDAQS
jgi:exodeoxyribonuclease VII small subunit